MLGQVVSTLNNSFLDAGKYDFKWEAKAFPSGLYVININSNNFTTTQKVMLLK